MCATREITNAKGFPQVVDEDDRAVCSSCECYVLLNTGQGTMCDSCRYQEYIECMNDVSLHDDFAGDAFNCKSVLAGIDEPIDMPEALLRKAEFFNVSGYEMPSRNPTLDVDPKDIPPFKMLNIKSPVPLQRLEDGTWGKRTITKVINDTEMPIDDIANKAEIIVSPESAFVRIYGGII